MTGFSGKTGSSDLPLHGGRCPPWLFDQMKQLGVAMVEVMLSEFGRDAVLKRFSDPAWFQSFGCVLGFDWHSSGLTTVVLGALKEGLNERAHEYGLFLAGGKGATSRKTPQELADFVDSQALNLSVSALQRSSRMAAKVDNSAVQDGYNLYHHCFLLSADGGWTVIQQGMQDKTNWARRYHWYSENVNSFLDDPHSGIDSARSHKMLNLASSKSTENRDISHQMASEQPVETLKEYKTILRNRNSLPKHLKFNDGHRVPRAATLDKALKLIYDSAPSEYTDLFETEGIGAASVRALAMVAEVACGVAPSYEDPVRYSFAHGGKDGHPYPVNRGRYRQTLDVLHNILTSAPVERSKRLKALKRLSKLRERKSEKRLLPEAMEEIQPEETSEDTSAPQLELEI